MYVELEESDKPLNVANICGARGKASLCGSRKACKGCFCHPLSELEVVHPTTTASCSLKVKRDDHYRGLVSQTEGVHPTPASSCSLKAERDDHNHGLVSQKAVCPSQGSPRVELLTQPTSDGVHHDALLAVQQTSLESEVSAPASVTVRSNRRPLPVRASRTHYVALGHRRPEV